MINYYDLHDTKSASKITGLSQSYIKQLCISNGREEFVNRELEEYFYAKKFGGTWVLDIKEFTSFYVKKKEGEFKKCN